MEEKINLVKNVIISIDLVSYNALGKKLLNQMMNII